MTLDAKTNKINLTEDVFRLVAKYHDKDFGGFTCGNYKFHRALHDLIWNSIQLCLHNKNEFIESWSAASYAEDEYKSWLKK